MQKWTEKTEERNWGKKEYKRGLKVREKWRNNGGEEKEGWRENN